MGLLIKFLFEVFFPPIAHFLKQIFCICQDLRPGKLPCPLHRDELNLGDIFLGVEFVMKQCQEESLDLHGVLTVSCYSKIPTPHIMSDLTSLKEAQAGSFSSC